MEAASEERGDLFGDLQMTDPQRLTLEDACRRPTMGVGLKTVRMWHPAVSSCSNTALYKLTFTLCCVCKVIQLLNQVHMNPSQEKCEYYFYRGLTVSFFNDLTVRKSHHSSVKLQQTHSPQRSSSLSLKSQDTFSFWRLNVILEWAGWFLWRWIVSGFLHWILVKYRLIFNIIIDKQNNSTLLTQKCTVMCLKGKSSEQQNLTWTSQFHSFRIAPGSGSEPCRSVNISKHHGSQFGGIRSGSLAAAFTINNNKNWSTDQSHTVNLAASVSALCVVPRFLLFQPCCWWLTLIFVPLSCSSHRRTWLLWPLHWCCGLNFQS